MHLETLAEGFGYPESPRFHDGDLWISDFDAGVVLAVDPAGEVSVRAAVPGTPSGIVFRDEEILVVSMEQQRVLRIDPSGDRSVAADLSALAVGRLNDMVVAPDGRLFVGCFGYDVAARERPRPGPLLTVSPDGDVSVACPDVTFANGMAVVDRGRTLLVAESPRSQITSFSIAEDGSLGSRSTFVDLKERRRQPDGICVDAEGGVWIGSPFSEEFIRVAADARITHVIPTPGRWAIACELGGSDGSTFFGVTAETDIGRFARGESLGRVEVGAAPIPRRTTWT